MDNFRTILFFALAFVLFLLWQAWQQDYGTPPPGAAQPQSRSQSAADQQAAPDLGDIPEAPTSAASDMPDVVHPAVAKTRPSARVRVVTDVFDIELNTRGGDIHKADLLAYPLNASEPGIPFPLLNDGEREFSISQSGLLGENAPNHNAVYEAARGEYRLTEGQQQLRVPLTWRGANGLEIEKIYTFHRGGYKIDLEYVIRNAGSGTWKGRFYRQLKRTEKLGEGDSAFIYTYTGAVVSYADKPYEKITFDDMRDAKYSADIKGGWVAMIQHYFLSAWIANENEINHAYSKVANDGGYVIGMVAPTTTLAPGESKTLTANMFVGPKLQNRLKDIAPNLELTVDYGWLTFLSKPLFWLLAWIHGVLANWGWSIIVLTIIVKLVFYKLSETQYRSMARLRELQPRLVALKERHGDDKQALQQGMMDLYKREKVNPFGGCLPLLVQMPVFIALYWVLLESVEMRQASFIFWLTDLSTPDPFYVLPLLMGATMLIQHKLNPAPMDPMQAKMMAILPIVFTVFFAFFPAGLVLYWTVNNMLSILQQWVITKRISQGG